MRLADEKSKCVSLQSRPLREFDNLVGTNGAGQVAGCKFPFIKCINHYSLSFHFSSETDGVKCVHGSAWQRRGKGWFSQFPKRFCVVVDRTTLTPPLPRRGICGPFIVAT